MGGLRSSGATHCVLYPRRLTVTLATEEHQRLIVPPLYRMVQSRSSCVISRFHIAAALNKNLDFLAATLPRCQHEGGEPVSISFLEISPVFDQAIKELNVLSLNSLVQRR